MGRDKALLQLEAGGPTLIELVANVAIRLSDDVIIVAPSERRYGDLVPGARVVPDAVADLGPIGGVITALREAKHDRVQLLPCDTPFLSPALLRILAERGSGLCPVIPWRYAKSRQGDDRALEVLHGVYPRHAREQLETLVDRGERQFFRIVQQLDPELIDPITLMRFDPGLHSFRSLNAPGDVAAIEPDLFTRYRRGLY